MLHEPGDKYTVEVKIISGFGNPAAENLESYAEKLGGMEFYGGFIWWIFVLLGFFVFCFCLF